MIWGSVSISAIIQYCTMKNFQRNGKKWCMSFFLLSHFLLLIFRLSFLYPSFYLSSYVIYILFSFSLTYLSPLSFLYHSLHTPSYVVISFSFSVFLLSLSFLHFLEVSNIIFILYSLLHSFRFQKKYHQLQ